MSVYQEYPRMVYRGAEETRVVNSDEEKAAAVSEGFRLSPDAEPPAKPEKPKRGK